MWRFWVRSSLGERTQGQVWSCLNLVRLLPEIIMSYYVHSLTTVTITCWSLWIVQYCPCRELECEIYMIVIMNLIIGLRNMNQAQGTGLKEVLNWNMHSRAIYAMHACYSCTMQSMCITAHTRTEFQSQSLLLVSHKISHGIARIGTINQARHIYFLISGACETIDIHTTPPPPPPPPPPTHTYSCSILWVVSVGGAKTSGGDNYTTMGRGDFFFISRGYVLVFNHITPKAWTTSISCWCAPDGLGAQGFAFTMSTHS